MEIIQIAALGIVSVILIIIIKAQRPEIAIQISIITGVIVFLMIAGKLAIVIELLGTFMKRVNIDSYYLTTLLKIIGIAYIAEFAAEVCKDSGESAIASKIELAGKVTIMVLAIPIVTSMLELVTRLIA